MAELPVEGWVMMGPGWGEMVVCEATLPCSAASLMASRLAALISRGVGVVEAIWGGGGKGCESGVLMGAVVCRCAHVLCRWGGALGCCGPHVGGARDDSAKAESALLLHQVLAWWSISLWIC